MNVKRAGLFLLTSLLGTASVLAVPQAGSTPPSSKPPKPNGMRPPAAVANVSAVKVPGGDLSVIRVDSTVQPYDFVRPWTKKAPAARQGIGAILGGGRVLVTAGMVANANYVEFETGENGERIPARVLAVDYEADLALLQAEDPKALKGTPLEIADAMVGDAVQIAQLEPTGAQVATNGLVTTVAVNPYPFGDLALLTYRLSSSLQYREASYTLPILKKGKLAGLLLRYDNRNQTVDAISAPVIRHFLAEVKKKERAYEGFPRAGMAFSALRDPQLRSYAQATGADGGVYITDVTANGPAGKAGLAVGDVLLSVAGERVDADGNFRDRTYGKVALLHLLSTHHFAGDVVPFEILRGGKKQTLSVTLAHRGLEEYSIAPFSDSSAPKYYVLGGLVLVELTRPYLREWGGDWVKKAPERFVYMDRFQDELFPTPRKLVILSQVLPTPLTIGDEQLGSLVVTKVNDAAIHGLADLPAALEHPVKGFHKIEFSESPRLLYLDAAQTEAIAPQVQQRYGLPAIKRLE